MTVAQKLQEATPFKKFDTEMSIRYDYDASQVLKSDYWRVTESFKFYIGEEADNTWVVVPAGFLTDGASVPRYLWWAMPAWSLYGQASALHDFLIEHQVKYVNGETVRVPRDEADRIFDEALKVNHVRKLQRWVMVYIVKWWGKYGWHKSDGFLAKKRVLESQW